MTCFIIAGEASGDRHAARLIKTLLSQNPDTVFYGMGGDKMQQAGCTLVRHISDMAFMGVVAVVENMGKVRENIHIAKQTLLDKRPDTLILVDYPSFNLSIARFCKKHLPDTKIVYFIPPKAWAWKTWRVHRIGKLCDRILCIFPFEVEFYKHYGYKAEYVGNPTAQDVEEYLSGTHSPATDNRSHSIAILPGSRRHEIEKCLTRMLDAALRQEGYSVVVAAMSSIEKDIYLSAIDRCTDKSRVELVFDNTYSVVSHADAAIVNSGTATLETALLMCPQAAVYHLAGGRLLELLQPLIFKIKYFTLVNIIAEREVIHEHLAHHFTVDNVAADLNDILSNTQRRQTMLSDYKEIKGKLMVKG